MKNKYTEYQISRMLEHRFLTDRERAVCELYYIRGWHIEDIAAELDEISRSTVSRDLKKARQKAFGKNGI